MEDIHLPALTSILSGYVISKNAQINIVRIVVYLILVGSFYLFKLDFSLTGIIVYSLSITILVWLVKLLLYILNVVINNTFEVTSSSSSNSKYSHTIDDGRPKNMPSTLWDHITDYTGDRQMNENDVLQLIQEGNDPDLVFQFYHLTKDRSITRNLKNQKKPKIKSKNTYLNCCGKLIPVGLTRLAVNELFPMNNSILYLILGLVFLFFTYFFIGININQFLSWQVHCACIVGGGAAYAFLAPPEEEAYSLTKGEIMNGLTRIVAITIVGFIWATNVYLAKHDKICRIEFTGTQLVINFKDVLNYVQPVCQYFISFLFIFVNFVVASPKTTFHFIVETIDTYLFGCGLSARLLHSLLLLIRGFAACYVAFVIGIDSKNIYSTPFLIAAVSLIVQFPLSWSTQLRKRFLVFVASIVFNVAFAFASGYLSIRFFNKTSALVLSIVAFFFDWIVPRLVSNNGYIFVHFRCFGFTSKILNILKILIKATTAPAILCFILKNTEAPQWFLIMLIVSSITKSLCEPHIYSFSLMVMFFTFRNDFIINDYALSAFLSLFIARKLLNVISFFQFYRLLRYYPLAISNSRYIEELGAWMFFKLYCSFPFIDRLTHFPSMIWSMLSGSPMYSPMLLTFITFPSSPRPSAFWDENTQLSASLSFTTRLTEHPVETPVYTSCARALGNSLDGLIKSGRIGVVDSGDIFLIINESMCAFIEIIALDTNCCHFKLRGLEYSVSTSCHRGELSTLRFNASHYELFPNLNLALIQDRTVWNLRALNVQFNQYSVNRYSLQTSFAGLERSDVVKWITYSFAYTIAHDTYFHKSDAKLSSTHPLVGACEIFDVNLNEDDMKHITDAYDVIIKYLFPNQGAFVDRFAKLFLGTSYFEADDNWLSNDNDLMDHLVNPSVRLSLTTLALASMQLSPEASETDEIPQFFDEVEEDYAALPIQSKEFDVEFKDEKKGLITITPGSNQSLLFFRIQMTAWDVYQVNREAIRTAWQSEAISQIFFSEGSNERESIQRYDELLHNLTVQSCDHPLGYPALVSPVIASYALPPGMQTF